MPTVDELLGPVTAPQQPTPAPQRLPSVDTLLGPVAAPPAQRLPSADSLLGPAPQAQPIQAPPTPAPPVQGRAPAPVMGPTGGAAVARPAPLATAPLSSQQEQILDRMVQVESGGNPRAISPAGAVGVRQVMPATAREIARGLGETQVARMNDAEITRWLQQPQNSDRYGRVYYDQMLRRYSGNHTLALAAYNAGPGAVDGWLRTIGDPRQGPMTSEAWASRLPVAETRNYIRAILGGGGVRPELHDPRQPPNPGERLDVEGTPYLALPGTGAPPNAYPAPQPRSLWDRVTGYTVQDALTDIGDIYNRAPRTASQVPSITEDPIGALRETALGLPRAITEQGTRSFYGGIENLNRGRENFREGDWLSGLGRTALGALDLGMVPLAPITGAAQWGVGDPLERAFNIPSSLTTMAVSAPAFTTRGAARIGSALAGVEAPTGQPLRRLVAEPFVPGNEPSVPRPAAAVAAQQLLPTGATSSTERVVAEELPAVGSGIEGAALPRNATSAAGAAPHTPGASPVLPGNAAPAPQAARAASPVAAPPAGASSLAAPQSALLDRVNQIMQGRTAFRLSPEEQQQVREVLGVPEGGSLGTALDQVGYMPGPPRAPVQARSGAPATGPAGASAPPGAPPAGQPGAAPAGPQVPPVMVPPAQAANPVPPAATPPAGRPPGAPPAIPAATPPAPAARTPLQQRRALATAQAIAANRRAAAAQARQAGTLRGAIAGIGDAFRTVFTPYARGGTAQIMADIARRNWGARDLEIARAEERVYAFSGAVRNMSQAERYAFLDAYETGNVASLPAEIQPVARQIYAEMDRQYNYLAAMGPEHTPSYVDNYIRHMYRNPEQAEITRDLQRQVRAGTITAQDAQRQIQDAMRLAGATPQMASLGGTTTRNTRSLEGGASFFRQRTVPTIRDAMTLGLVPVTDNPLELAMLGVRGVQQYITGQHIMEEARATGLARPFRRAAEAPHGWVAIDDPIARSIIGLPGGGTTQWQYYMPEPAARLINNHLTPSAFRDPQVAPLFDLIRGTGNMLNMVQLGLSAYHAGFTTMDAAISQVSLGIEQLVRGLTTGDARTALRGAGNALVMAGPAAVGAAVAGPVGAAIGGAGGMLTAAALNVRRGNRLLSEYLVPGSRGGQVAPIVRALAESGGRIRMDEFYREGYPSGTFLRLFTDRGRMVEADTIAAARDLGRMPQYFASLIPRTIATVSAPIMEELVPRQKLGVFFNMAQDFIRSHPNVPIEQMTHDFALMWDSVDNRLGEIVYDNLFWNRTFRDIAHLSVRSVGWNLGTIREVGGGIRDIPQLLRTGEMTRRTAYVVGLTATTALAGAITTYLTTGHGPESDLDYFFPPTGGTHGGAAYRGVPERINFPSYARDIVEWADDPFGTAAAKVHPLITLTFEMLRNRDFMEHSISTQNDDFMQAVWARMSHTGAAFLPYGVSNLRRPEPQGSDFRLPPWTSFFGVSRAPARVSANEEQTRRAQQVINRRADRGVLLQREMERLRNEDTER